jgi:hypothetical protein
MRFVGKWGSARKANDRAQRQVYKERAYAHTPVIPTHEIPGNRPPNHKTFRSSNSRCPSVSLACFGGFSDLHITYRLVYRPSTPKNPCRMEDVVEFDCSCGECDETEVFIEGIRHTDGKPTQPRTNSTKADISSFAEMWLCVKSVPNLGIMKTSRPTPKVIQVNLRCSPRINSPGRF